MKHGIKIKHDKLFPVKWAVVEADLKSYIFDSISPVDGEFQLNVETADIRSSTLPWYSSFNLLRIRDSSWSPDSFHIYYLYNQSWDLYRLDGEAPPIHFVNELSPISLSVETVTEYLKFFCFFLQVDGPFLIVEDFDELILPDCISMDVLSKLKASVREVKYKGKIDNDCYLLNATVYYSNELSQAEFSVDSNGHVDITSVPLTAQIGGLIHP